MPANWYRVNSNGTTVKIKGIHRLNSNGTFAKIKSIFRLNSDGTFAKVFAGLETPSVKVASPPYLYIVDPSGFADPGLDAYTSYKMYLTRGKWNEDPLEFVMRIQRSTSLTFSSPTNLIDVTKTYTTYSDSDFEFEVPTNTANRPVITNALIRAGNYYRGSIKATNSDDLFDTYITPVVKPRIDAQLNIIANLGGTIGTNPTATGGTFSWLYNGYESIVAADVFSQTISFYPQGNTSGTPIYSQSVSPGTSTTSAPLGTAIVSNSALQANTTYTVVVSSVMNDLWKTESDLLKTIVSDFGDFTTAADKPATPSITSATDVGTNRPYNDGAVSLSWTQPSGGATVTGYKIEYSVGPDHIAYIVLNSNTGNTNTSGTFTGLDANKNYKFYVTALSTGQNSDRSDASSSVLITTVPNIPTGVTAVAGDALANVSYNAPTFTGGKSIINYRATSTPSSISATDIVSPIEVTGLTNYTAYTFTVAARNANGYSVESAASNSVTPKLPLPVGSGTVTITYDSESSYVYKITGYGTWSNSATKYDYEWQTSPNNSTWTTRSSGTDVSTIPNYNAATYNGNFIRLRVYGRNQTGPAVTPLVSATTTIFYTRPIINSFSVSGSELFASWSYSYSADDPGAGVQLEYKLSSSSTWTIVAIPSSTGSVSLSPGTYDFRLFVTNSASGAFRSALATVSSVVVSSIYSFSFGNILYPSTNGYIGLSEGSLQTSIPSTGKYLVIFPGDFVGNTSNPQGYTLVWSDSSKYVLRFDGYSLGQFGNSAYRITWMATFYTASSFVDVKIIRKGSSISSAVTVGLYRNGSLVSGLPGPYTIPEGRMYRINFASNSGSILADDFPYDEILAAVPNDVMRTAGTKFGSGDDDIYYSITTAANTYNSPTVSFGTLSGGTSTLSIPFTESNGCDYVTYTVRTTSYSGTIIASSSSLTSPISVGSLNANTTYYITLTPYNYKNQVGSQIQTTALTAPPQPTVTFSSVTSSSFNIAWSSTGATHYDIQLFDTINGNNVSGYPVNNTTSTSASVSGLTANRSYTAVVYAKNSISGFQSTARTVSQTTLFGPLVPTFGTNTRVSGGFNGSVTNYDSNYTFNLTTSAGSVSPTTFSGVSGTKTFSVTGLAAGSSATVTVTTSRSGYDPGSNTTSSSALSNLITNPAYGTATSATGGFSASISTSPNPTGGTYSVVTQTNGTASVNSSTGALTVTGLTAGQSSTATVRYSLSGYNSVDITSTGSASVVQYTVTWNANGGTGGGTTGPFNAGTSHTAPSPGTRSGFTFSGYNDTPSGDFTYGPIASGGSFTPPSSITMYARWAAIVPNVTQITARGLGNTAAPYIRFTITSTNAASLSIMLYRSSTSSTGPWTALSTPSVQSTSGTLVADFGSRTGTTSNWYYVDVTPYFGADATGTAGTTRTSRVKRGSDTTTTTVYP